MEITREYTKESIYFRNNDIELNLNDIIALKDAYITLCDILNYNKSFYDFLMEMTSH